MMRWPRYNGMTVGDTSYCLGNVKGGPGLCLLDGMLIEMMMNSYMGYIPKSNMKKGWLCRTTKDVYI